MRRVAIFRTDLLPVSETFVRDQASALEAWQPVLIGLRETQAGLETPGIRREIVAGAGNRYSKVLRYWLARPIPHLVRRLKDLDADVVHAHFGTDATDVWPSVRAAGLPMLVTLHGYDINIHREWWEAGHGGLRGRVYPRQLLQMARHPAVHFIAVSQAIQRRAVEYGIPEGKIRIAHIGVDTRRFKPSGLPMLQRRKRILFVGRMVEKKAPLLMVRAYAEVRKAMPDAELAMIGEGPLLSDARKLARDLAAPVEFFGSCSSDEVIAQLHQARVFCLPSVTAANGDAEGLPVSILEAAACGIPVVTSAQGGATEGIIDGKTGYRFAEGAIDECAHRLFEILGDTDVVTAMSENASAFAAENFDIVICAGELEKYYEAVL